ncbi:homoserine kinase [Flavobacteriaceae bacterium]|jgi:homoserine kinase|nr:homoserine kinase [Flavobacteriaceae bacterium]MBT4298260.1 homoserine kinase [Flavobacteriaceae bacterium]MBT4960238.1 homoserine kinase [Flavobacteriaceae bacterium]MBT5232338.1 homoserine kinase [Flavobacteriaceae bacterium]MBT5492809.1 homoserine kinase [Flavobacteriaceae bacterium]|tara:strand:- start:7703 stop:8632 length:930 start_codon:yes stop_codon:yes gene_type:complete
MNEIKVFSPASIANLSCGYDILGVCLDNIGDEITVRKTKKKGVVIKKVSGQKLSTDISLNVAGVSATALLNETKVNCGFEIEIHKGIKPGSGIGSSAASSAGSVFAINKLIGEPYTNKELIKFAMYGEMAASGSKHADNVAAVLLGGFTFVRNSIENDYFKLNTPIEIAFTVIHPKIELKTKDSRAVVKDKVLLKNMIEQSANLGAFISGLYTEDYDLIGRSLKDVIIEPLRSVLIPKFEKIKSVSINSGALGCGISGSGPSVFAMCKGVTTAINVGNAMKKIYDKLDLDYDVHISCVNDIGIKILKTN